MATFNLGPHPRMLKILEDNNLKETVTLIDFIEALKLRERGYRWEDITPTDAVDMVVWLELYEAYVKDEEDINGWKAAQDDRRNEYHRGGAGDYRIADGNGGGFEYGADLFTD